MDTGCCLTVSTGSVKNTSHRSAVAPRAASGGGVAVVGPASAAMPRQDRTIEETSGRAGSSRDRVPSLQSLIMCQRRRCPDQGAGVTSRSVGDPAGIRGDESGRGADLEAGSKQAGDCGGCSLPGSQTHRLIAGS